MADTEKINPKDFGFNPKEWGKINKQVRDWITLNKELWNNLTKYEQKALKNSRDMAKNAKETSMAAEEVRNLAREHAKAIKNMGGSTKSNLAMMGTLADLGLKALKYDQKSDILSKKRFKAISGVVDITGDYLANMDAIGTDEFQSLDFNKKIREAIKAKLPDEEAYLRLLKVEYDIQKKLNAEITSQADLIKKPFGMLDDMVKRIPIFGDMMSKKLDLTGMGEEYANKFVESAKQAAAAQKELELNATGFATNKAGETYGIDKGVQKKKKAELDAQSKSGKMMKKMGPYALAVGAAIGAWAVGTLNFARELGVSMSEMRAASLFAKEETKALLDEFGSLRDVSEGLLLSMKWQAFWTGAQATDMAKIMMLQTSITGDTKAMALDRQAKFMKEIRKEGLSASKIMGDLASHADMFAMYAKDGGKNMEEAAKQAAGMGLSLDATNSVAEKLLDWEESIAAEMEASMLLGKQINLDKARELAYNGDLAAMMTEVKNQAGGEAEFAKMTVVQRQSLGDAIGLTGEKLAEFMKADEKGSREAAKSKVLQWAAIGAIAGAVIGMIGAGLAAAVSFGTLTWAGIGWTIAALAAGGAAGGIIGGIIGSAAGGATAGDVMSPADGKTVIKTKEGDIRALSPRDDLAAAPGLLNTLKGGQQQSTVVNVDNSEMVNTQKETNLEIRRLVTSFEYLMTKNINATKDVGAQY